MSPHGVPICSRAANPLPVACHGLARLPGRTCRHAMQSHFLACLALEHDRIAFADVRATARGCW